MATFGNRDTRSHKKKRAAEAHDGKSNDRRQRKPGDDEASSTVMFGSDGHIVFSQSNSVLEPLIRTLWESTICSADVRFLRAKKSRDRRSPLQPNESESIG